MQDICKIIWMFQNQFEPRVRAFEVDQNTVWKISYYYHRRITVVRVHLVYWAEAITVSFRSMKSEKETSHLAVGSYSVVVKFCGHVKRTVEAIFPIRQQPGGVRHYSSATAMRRPGKTNPAEHAPSARSFYKVNKQCHVCIAITIVCVDTDRSKHAWRSKVAVDQNSPQNKSFARSLACWKSALIITDWFVVVCKSKSLYR